MGRMTIDIQYILWKITNLWNHQPVTVLSRILNIAFMTGATVRTSWGEPPWFQPRRLLRSCNFWYLGGPQRGKLGNLGVTGMSFKGTSNWWDPVSQHAGLTKICVILQSMTVEMDNPWVSIIFVGKPWGFHIDPYSVILLEGIRESLKMMYTPN